MKMKIQRKNKSKPVRFESLEPGQLFEYNGRLMIKMSTNEEADAYDLNYDIMTFVMLNMMVIPLNATLTVED